jgi:flagellar biosynthesis protein FliQ
MSQDLVLTLARDALMITLWLSGPLLLVSLVVGIFVSIAQVVTSIQDMVLSFVPRVVAVFAVFLLIFPWLMGMMVHYTGQLLGHLERFAR